MNKDKIVKGGVISTFVLLYLLVSVISTIHVIDFFELSNPHWLAVTLAIGFELGAAASLASLVILKKMNKGLVWALFITITLMQMQGNMYYAFKNLENFQAWSELFNLIEDDVIYQKRILALVSGAILPLVALGFIKSLVDYIKPEDNTAEDLETPSDSVFNDIESMRKVVNAHDTLEKEIERVKEDEWDEDHALDVVLNTMVDEIGNHDPAEEAELKAWESTLLDGLTDLQDLELEITEDYNDSEALVDENLPSKDNNPTSVGAIVSDADLLSSALRKKAQEEMDNYLKDKESDNKVTN